MVSPLTETGRKKRRSWFQMGAGPEGNHAGKGSQLGSDHVVLAMAGNHLGGGPQQPSRHTRSETQAKVVFP